MGTGGCVGGFTSRRAGTVAKMPRCAPELWNLWTSLTMRLRIRLMAPKVRRPLMPLSPCLIFLPTGLMAAESV